MQAVLEDLKHPASTREERLNRYIANDLILEKCSFDDLKQQVGSSLDTTPEKCLADCGFTPFDRNLALPIQLKSSSNSLFCSTAGYDTMLLICRSNIYRDLGWLCIPGAGLPSNIELRPKGKYGPFLVQTDVIQSFLLGLYTAVEKCECSYQWPSGKLYDISTIHLKPFVDLCVPHNRCGKVEYNARTWRQTIMASIHYRHPPYQGMHYDVICDNVRIQDKTAVADHISGRYAVTLSKSMGLTRGKLKTGPYGVEDFDALCIMCHDRQYIFLIPMHVLSDMGYASCPGQDGKCAIHCYSMDYTVRPTGRRPKLWTQKYCYRAGDPDLQEKFRRALLACR